MKVKLLVLALIIFGGFMFTAAPVEAQFENINMAAGLVPCEDGTKCTACDLIKLGNNVIDFLIGVLTVVFAVLAMVAGFKLVTSGGNPSAKQDAKSMLTNAIIGFILVLAAWILVDTFLRVLLPNGEVNGSLWWQSIKCEDFAQVAPTIGHYVVPESQLPRGDNEGNVDGSGDGGTIPPASGNIDTSEYTHAQAVAALGGGFALSSSGNCTDRTNRRCTSLDGVKKNTITRLREFRAGYGSEVVITGGTEIGHAAGTYSHSNGYKIDLRRTPSLDSYIQNNLTKYTSTKWKDKYGNVYWREDSLHWDVTFNQ